MAGGQYCCWNPGCNFRSHRPWIKPPEKNSDVKIAKELEIIIGECLHASADGPFFVDNAAKANPYWEFETLFGFTPEEVRQISSQWPNVDITDKYIAELIGSCFANLIGYPHRCERYWPDYVSVTREQLIDHAKSWRNSKYA